MYVIQVCCQESLHPDSQLASIAISCELTASGKGVMACQPVTTKKRTKYSKCGIFSQKEEILSKITQKCKICDILET